MCSPDKLAAVYLDVLVDVLGLAAAMDEDGDIVVQHGDGWKFVVQNTAPDDPEFLHVFAVFPVAWEPVVLTAACTATNAAVKGAKMTPLIEADGKNGYICHVEMVVAPKSCLPTREHLAAILPRAVDMLEAGLEVLHQSAEARAPGAA